MGIDKLLRSALLARKPNYDYSDGKQTRASALMRRQAGRTAAVTRVYTRSSASRLRDQFISCGRSISASVSPTSTLITATNSSDEDEPYFLQEEDEKVKRPPKHLKIPVGGGMRALSNKPRLSAAWHSSYIT